MYGDPIAGHISGAYEMKNFLIWYNKLAQHPLDKRYDVTDDVNYIVWRSCSCHVHDCALEERRYWGSRKSRLGSLQAAIVPICEKLSYMHGVFCCREDRSDDREKRYCGAQEHVFDNSCEQEQQAVTNEAKPQQMNELAAYS